MIFQYRMAIVRSTCNIVAEDVGTMTVEERNTVVF